MAPFAPSPYQAAIFDFDLATRGNLAVEAVAGSGKTTTAIELLRRYTAANPKHRCVFLAFSRAIATEMGEKIHKAGIACDTMTIHSLGRKALLYRHAGSELVSGKYRKLLKDSIEGAMRSANNRGDSTFAECLAAEYPLKALCKIIDLARLNLLGKQVDGGQVADLCVRYDITHWSPALDAFCLRAINFALADGLAAAKDTHDYTDMLWVPAIMGWNCIPFDLVVVDECQDLSGAQRAVVGRAVRYGTGRLVAVGDHHQCQPGDTQITMEDGSSRRIDSLRSGDKVRSYDRRSAMLVRGAEVTEAEQRFYTGNLIVVATSGGVSRSTDNHKWLARWDKHESNADTWICYLMRSGTKWRVGITKLFHIVGPAWNLSLGTRCRGERADAGWILTTGTYEEMAVEERVVASTYGMCQTPFVEPTTSARLRQSHIDTVYARIGDRTEPAIRCLVAYGRHPEHPLWNAADRRRHGRATLFEVAACNLMSDLMVVPTVSSAWNTTRPRPGWTPIKVTHEHFTGLVYSLNVAHHHKYVADGLVTCNSIFGFAGADSDSFDRVVSDFRCTVLPLSVCYRCPTSVLDIARTLVPQIEARPGAPVGSVEFIEDDDLTGDLQGDELVLCRTTAPLISACYAAIRAAKPSYVVGRDIGQGLTETAESILKVAVGRGGLVERFDWSTFGSAADAWVSGERAKILARNDGDDEDPALDAVADRAECCRVIWSENCASIASLDDFGAVVARLFDPEVAEHPVRFSTAHRCVAPDTLVDTPRGLLAIDDIPNDGVIGTASGPQEYTNKIRLASRERLKITTKRGYSVVVTPDHKMFTWSKEAGDYVAVPAMALELGGLLRLRLGSDFVGTRPPPQLPPAPECDVRAAIYSFPACLTADVAEFLGLMVSDGTVFDGGFRLVKRYVSVATRFASHCAALFGATPSSGYGRHGECHHVEVHSVQIVRWLRLIGGMDPCDKYVPACIMRAPLAIQAAFLRGLFEDGTIRVRAEGDTLESVWWSAGGSTQDPERFAQVVQTMLLRLGLISTRFPVSGRVDWRVALYGEHAAAFCRTVGFVCTEKIDKCHAAGHIPADQQASIPIPLHLTGLGKKFSNARHRGTVGRGTARRWAAGEPGALSHYCQDALRWHHDPIEKIEPVGVGPVLCVEVPATGRFLQNGFDGSNSKGLEADVVFILRPELMPFPKARTAEQVAQEMNLLYVAVTRAMKRLVICGDPAWAGPEGDGPGPEKGGPEGAQAPSERPEPSGTTPPDSDAFWSALVASGRAAEVETLWRTGETARAVAMARSVLPGAGESTLASTLGPVWHGAEQVIVHTEALR